MDIWGASRPANEMSLTLDILALAEDGPFYVTNFKTNANGEPEKTREHHVYNPRGQIVHTAKNRSEAQKVADRFNAASSKAGGRWK
jgi:hypothetical protein